MMVMYTEEELILKWREAHGLAPFEGALESDGEAQMEAMIREKLRNWYARLLLEAPVERLPQQEMSSAVREGKKTANGMMFKLPSRGVRVVSVKLPEWEEPVSVFHKVGSYAHRRQRDLWLRSGEKDPVAVIDGSMMYIYGTEPITASLSEGDAKEKVGANFGARLEHLIMVAAPEDGTYEFDEADMDFSK